VVKNLTQSFYTTNPLLLVTKGCIKMTQQETFIQPIQDNGRITVPQPVRTFLGLKEGDLVRFIIEKVTPV
jgi:AbrB family looped-hinge helix DNA binding protein